jgi:hypothetical protein
MENEKEKQQQAQEDLRIIRQMMEDTRRQVADNGLHYLSWTVFVALGIIGTYTVVLYGLEGSNIFWVWLTAIGGGWIVSFILGHNDAKARSYNFAEKLLSAIWMGAGVSMTIVAFTGVATDAFQPNYIPAMIASILGIPYFAASFIYDLSWFRYIAVGWWVAGIGFFIWGSFHTLAVLGVLMILFQAVPGLYLYNNFGTVQAD